MHHEDRTRTYASLLGAIAGAAWIIDVAVITAIDDSFDPLDSILFVGGLACLVAMSGLLGVVGSRRLAGGRRALAASGIAIGLIGGLVLVSMIVDAASHALYHGGNRGLHKECGIFAIGAATLAIAGLVHRIPGRRTLELTLGDPRLERAR